MFRITRLVLLIAIVFFGAAPVASASSAKKPDNNLAALWTTVLETPTAQNSLGSGGSAFACWNLGRTVAPLDDVLGGGQVVHSGDGHKAVRCREYMGVQHVRGDH
ncbi:MAG: hypothetical protein QOD72_3035 [Acidimicrobiaceae bacterium]|nr:hypothetical protein [Acidimicrobiaceae bacterium]